MRHRLVLVAAVAVLGGLTLSGCQRDPEVAARVDGQVITQTQVDQIFVDSPPVTKVPAGQTGPAEITRADVVRSLVLDDLCAKVQKAENFGSAQVTPAQIAQGYNVAADSPFAVQEAKTRSCLSGAVVDAEPAPPTDAEFDDIYRRATAAGIQVGPANEVKAAFSQNETVQQWVGLKHSLDRVINAGALEVNPRYRGLDFPLTDLNYGVPLIVATIGPPGSDAIRH